MCHFRQRLERLEGSFLANQIFKIPTRSLRILHFLFRIEKEKGFLLSLKANQHNFSKIFLYILNCLFSGNPNLQLKLKKAKYSSRSRRNRLSISHNTLRYLLLYTLGPHWGLKIPIYSYLRLFPTIFESQIRRFRGDVFENGKNLNQTIILVSLLYIVARSAIGPIEHRWHKSHVPPVF